MTAHDHLKNRDKHRLSVGDYLLLDREGAFGDRDTELFDGEVYYMSPKHRPHARAVTRLVIRLEKALAAGDTGFSVLSDVSVRMSEHDVSEPDIAITDEPDGEGLLPLDSVKLLAEVADSTIARDLGEKVAIYASANVPEYWVFDVNGRRIIQMWAPRGGTYAERREIARGKLIEAATIPGLTVDTAAI